MRSIRKQTFAWQEKFVLRLLREHYQNDNVLLQKVKLLYFTLTEIDSDFNGKEIMWYTKTIHTYSGLNKNWIPIGLRILEDLKIVKITGHDEEYKSKHGERGKFIARSIEFTPENINRSPESVNGESTDNQITDNGERGTLEHTLDLEISNQDKISLDLKKSLSYSDLNKNKKERACTHESARTDNTVSHEEKAPFLSSPLIPKDEDEEIQDASHTDVDRDSEIIRFINLSGRYLNGKLTRNKKVDAIYQQLCDDRLDTVYYWRFVAQTDDVDGKPAYYLKALQDGSHIDKWHDRKSVLMVDDVYKREYCTNCKREVTGLSKCECGWAKHGISCNCNGYASHYVRWSAKPLTSCPKCGQKEETKRMSAGDKEAMIDEEVKKYLAGEEEEEAEEGMTAEEWDNNSVRDVIDKLAEAKSLS